MKAVVLNAEGSVEVRSVSDPVIEDPEDALVAVHYAGICGTDLHLVAEHSAAPGTVLGHEYVGRVLQIGAAVRGIEPGDSVSGADYTACGRCWWCRRGDHWECQSRQFFGTGSSFGDPLAGAQAEIVRVPHADTVLQVLPQGVPSKTAVFLGDVLATGYAAVARASLRPGDCVTVVGGGPVGQVTSLVAQACSAGPVIVIEPVAERRQLASDQGALVADPASARGVVDSLTAGRGADVVVDAVGGPRGLDTAFELVRRRGEVMSAGVHTHASWPLPAAQAFADELGLRFVVGDAMRDRDAVTALVAAGLVDPTSLVSETVSLDEAPEAYARMASRRTLKALIQM